MWWGHLFPLVALLLMSIPLFRLEPAPFGVWPFILLLNLLVVGLALAWASAVGLVAAVALTLLVAGCWILRVPPAVESLAAELLVIGVFAVFFIVAGAVAARRFTGVTDAGTKAGAVPGGFGSLEIPAEWLPQIPALSAVLPFTLLILVNQRLTLPDPSALFGLALLLVVLMLGISLSFGLAWLPLVRWAVSWHSNTPGTSDSWTRRP